MACSRGSDEPPCVDDDATAAHTQTAYGRTRNGDNSALAATRSNFTALRRRWRDHFHRHSRKLSANSCDKGTRTTVEAAMRPAVVVGRSRVAVGGLSGQCRVGLEVVTVVLVGLRRDRKPSLGPIT